MNATPFIYGKIAENEDFTNREKDFAYLTNNFNGLVNTIIISPRRWGKTSLVNKTAESFSKNNGFIVCNIDLFNCRNEEQFYTTFASTVLKSSFTAWDELINGAKKYLSQMLPKIALADVTQTFELSFGVNFKDHTLSLDEILNLPQTIAVESNKKVIVCIDEFQNVDNYTDSVAFQQKLRSHWQLQSKVNYCLYGSKRHMLMRLFNDSSMPFYKFGDIVFLQKIERTDWVHFIVKRFNDTGKTISNELAGMIADKMKNHPYYTQQLSQQVWFRTSEICTADHVNVAFEALVNQLSLLFSNIIDTLTNKQINFLVAIANGERSFSSKEVLLKYDLGTSANIKNLKQVALNKDIIDILPKNKIEYQDPVFEYWIVNYYQKG